MLLIAIILGLVEGFTEFLPISSTGHLILAGSLLGFTGPKAEVFEIAIQTGAIMAVILVYGERLRGTVVSLGSSPVSRRFVLNVAVAFAPAVVLGLLFGDTIKHYLFNPVSVAVALVVGGLVILWAERGRRNPAPRVTHVDAMTVGDAFKVGMLQCLALLPGTSRSGATIIGGMISGLSRPVATEFSFYLAIPTLIGAGLYSLYKDWGLLELSDLFPYLTGLTVSFFSAWLCIRWLLRYVATHDFVPFAWYRIIFGAIILITAWSGLVRWTA
jgi:undecaprenyl-diphosphatase